METIIKVITGSTAYGVNTEGSDVDYVEIVLEPLTFMTPVFESAQKKNPDLAVYSLQKYCRLAAAGNPNMIEVLYSPVVETSAIGDKLITLNWALWSQQAGKKFLGYMQAQRERLLGLRGQKDVNRPDLVEKYGYDTKYAYHIIRLGIIRSEYMLKGYMDIPLYMQDRMLLTSIRNGGVKLEEVLERAVYYENKLKEYTNRKQVPERPRQDILERFLQETYLQR
jgi:hypothetical protein